MPLYRSLVRMTPSLRTRFTLIFALAGVLTFLSYILLPSSAPSTSSSTHAALLSQQYTSLGSSSSASPSPSQSSTSKPSKGKVFPSLDTTLSSIYAQRGWNITFTQSHCATRTTRTRDSPSLSRSPAPPLPIRTFPLIASSTHAESPPLYPLIPVPYADERLFPLFPPLHGESSPDPDQGNALPSSLPPLLPPHRASSHCAHKYDVAVLSFDTIPQESFDDSVMFFWLGVLGAASLHSRSITVGCVTFHNLFHDFQRAHLFTNIIAAGGRWQFASQLPAPLRAFSITRHRIGLILKGSETCTPPCGDFKDCAADPARFELEGQRAWAAGEEGEERGGVALQRGTGVGDRDVPVGGSIFRRTIPIPKGFSSRSARSPRAAPPGTFVFGLHVYQDCLLLDHHRFHQFPLGPSIFTGFPASIEQMRVLLRRHTLPLVRERKSMLFSMVSGPYEQKHGRLEAVQAAAEFCHTHTCYVQSLRTRGLFFLAKFLEILQPSRQETPYAYETVQWATRAYIDGLTDSVFTLCPAGKNPESYRIYEAILSGSIPVIHNTSIAGNTHNACSHPYQFLVDAGAPLLFVNGWNELEMVLGPYMRDLSLAQELQSKMLRWWSEKFIPQLRGLAVGLVQDYMEPSSS